MNDLVTVEAETSGVKTLADEAPAAKMTREEAEWTDFGSMFGITDYAGARRVAFDILRINTAVACMDVISQDIAKAKLRMYRRLGKDSRQEVMPSEHPTAKLLDLKPNPRQNWRVFWLLTFARLVLHEEMFIVKRITRRGDLRQLLPVVPPNVQEAVLETTRERFWQISRPTVHDRLLLWGIPERVPADDVIHIIGRTLDGFRGYSTLHTASGTFSLAQKLNEYQQRLYGRDARQRGVFEMPEKSAFNDDSFRRLRQQIDKLWNKFVESEVPIILEAGATFRPINSNAKDSEIAKAAQDSISDICRAFRVPQHKVGHLQAIKYENLEIQERTYVNDCLIPRAQAVEAELPFHLLEEEEQGLYEFEFDREMMAATDPTARANIADKMVKNGSITWDESRRELGWDPLPNGQGKNRMVPVNMAVIDPAGEVVVQGADPAAAPAGDGEDEEKPAGDGGQTQET